MGFSQNPIMGFLVFVLEIFFSPMGVVNMVLLSSDRKNCSHCLKFDTKYEGILESRMRSTWLDQECSSKTMS